MEALFALVGIIVLIPLLILYDSFSWGYVACVMYGWFILPLFPNLPILTWVHFAGIAFFLHCFFRTGNNANIKDEYKDATHGLVSAIISPWIALACAWLFKAILS